MSRFMWGRGKVIKREDEAKQGNYYSEVPKDKLLGIPAQA